MEIDLREYLTSVATCIMLQGYKKSGDYYETPTWKLALALYKNVHKQADSKDKELLQTANVYDYDNNSLSLASDTYHWVCDVVPEKPSEYLDKLKNIFDKYEIEKSDLPIVASSVYVYVDNKVKQEKREAANKKLRNEIDFSEFKGQIGQKYTINNIKAIEYPGSFMGFTGDICYVNKIIDTNDNVFIWMTGKQIPENTKTVTGTVKDHKEFRGVKQTILTRCKFA